MERRNDRENNLIIRKSLTAHEAGLNYTLLIMVRNYRVISNVGAPRIVGISGLFCEFEFNFVFYCIRMSHLGVLIVLSSVRNLNFMKPIKISRPTPDRLEISWDDGHIGLQTLRHLRDTCPCAGCQGETVLLRRVDPHPQDPNAPGRYDLVRIGQVGSYAIQPTWGDGHSSGIYTWTHLRVQCECAKCSNTMISGHAL